MAGRKLLISADAKPYAKQHRAPCSDCPWARDSLPGWLGPNTISEWLQAAHSNNNVINCHTRNQPCGDAWECAGAAIYRSNVLQRVNPGLLSLPTNTKLVFSFNEFASHHSKGKF